MIDGYWIPYYVYEITKINLGSYISCENTLYFKKREQ